MSVTRVLLVTTACAALTACGGSTDPLGGGVPDPAGDGPGPIGAWVLAEATPPIDVPDGARITLTVEDAEDGTRAGGTAACNGYGGALTWDAESGAWALGDLAATEMGCEQPLMAAEAAYLDALAQVDRYAVEGDRLVLTGGEVRLGFEHLPVVEPASLAGTTWVLDGLVAGDGEDATVASGATGVPSAELRFDEDGTFTLFTGCRDFTGEWATSGDEVVLPSLGETADSRGVSASGDVDCDPAAMQQEEHVLGVLEGSFPAVVEGRTLTVQGDQRGLVLRAADDA